MTGKIIVTVGTSTIEKLKWDELPWLKGEANPLSFSQPSELEKRCNEYNYNRLYNIYLDLETFDEDYVGVIRKEYQKVKNDIKWKTNIWRLMPAEVGSTKFIADKLKIPYTECEVVLMVSDTAQSYISAQVVKALLEDLGFKVNISIIELFQMEDIEKFTDKGLPNFINEIKKHMTEGLQVFNITGGYKNFIPIITHVASFYRRDMYYAFEESINDEEKALVKVPRIPTFNTVLSKKRDIIINLIEELHDRKYTDPYDACDFIEKTISFNFRGLGEALDSYLDFIKDFFEYNNGILKLSLFGETYLRLINENY